MLYTRDPPPVFYLMKSILAFAFYTTIYVNFWPFVALFPFSPPPKKNPPKTLLNVSSLGRKDIVWRKK